jgi:hypothetical protein
VGQPGMLFPEYLHLDDSLFLLARTAVPRGWSLHQTGKSGRIERRSQVSSQSTTRPVVTADSDNDEVTFAWPQERRQTRTRLEMLP